MIVSIPCALIFHDTKLSAYVVILLGAANDFYYTL